MRSLSSQPLIYEDSVFCPSCQVTFIHRTNVLNRGVLEQKEYWNVCVQDHLIDCATEKLGGLNEAMVKLLNWLGVNHG